MDPEKKKLVAVGALVVAILGIGAFQFLGSPPALEPVVQKKASEEKKDDPKAVKPAKNPMYASALGVRDPFQPASFSIVAEPEPATPVNPAPSNSAPVASTGKISWLPPGLGGSFPTGPTPGGMIPAGVGEPLVQAPALPIVPAKPRFGFSLTGVVVGEQSLAVFRDAKGGERMIPVGGTLDSTTRLISVREGEATVRFHGETLTLILGETK